MVIRGGSSNDLEDVEVIRVGLFVDLLVRPLVCESGVLQEDGVLVEVEVDGLEGKTKKGGQRGGRRGREGERESVANSLVRGSGRRRARPAIVKNGFVSSEYY